MKELTDLEICKRIAEIEGLDFYLLDSDGITYPLIKVWQDSVLKDKCVPKKYFESHDYNPLTDDALNVSLRDSYCVEIQYDGYCMIYDETHSFTLVEVEWSDTREINKATCLAIIEAND